MVRFFAIALFFSLFIISCSKNKQQEVIFDSNLYDLKIPEGLPELQFPNDNPLTKAKIELGKRLFEEPLFSSDTSLACISCHLPKFAFTDGNTLAIGVKGREGFRNSISLVNVGYQKLLFADGGVRTLEMQVLVPSDTHFEFDKSLPQVVEDLKSDTTYVNLFLKAFNKEPTVYGITRAIASYERTLLFANSKYDEDSREGWTEKEKLGETLFFGKAKCATCHTPPLFTDQNYYKLFRDENDEGRFRITRDSINLHQFKVPSLRNVAITSPYMHDGRIETLAEVIQLYDTTKSFKDPKLNGISLNQSEKEALLAFLETLTSKEFLD